MPSKTPRSGSASEVVYVSYDGALDPLGASQVVPYLRGLASHGFCISLVSFEKAKRWAETAAREALRQRLNEAGIRWVPLRYHKRPRLPATAYDVVTGALTVARLVRRHGAKLVHCRGDVAMAMARLARLPQGVRLLYDIRGFYSDERSETSSWASDGLIDRTVRRIEADNLTGCDGFVVLTRRALAELERRHNDLPPHRVIPTCADTKVFRPSEGAPAEFGLAYCGSLGTWYMADEMASFARIASRRLEGRVLFLTPDTEAAHSAGITPDWAHIRFVPPAEVPSWLRKARALFFFIRPSRAKRASSPTKLAEALATGLPVVANRGIGDLDDLLEARRVGVLVERFEDSEYELATSRLADLLSDPTTPRRCQDVAEREFGLDIGVQTYADLYRDLGTAPARGGS